MQQAVLNLPIKKIITESSRVKTFVIGTDFPGKPGQIVFATIGEHGERPFGIIKKDRVGFMITVAAVGTATHALHQMKVGDTLGFRGPIGTAFTDPLAGQTIILIAGGYGVAPLSYLAQEARKKNCQIHLFLGSRCREDLLFLDWMQEIGVTLHLATNDGSYGLKGFNTDLFDQEVGNINPDMVYVVGPEIMEMKVAHRCFEKNIPFEVSLERYREYGIKSPIVNGEELRQIEAFCMRPTV